jgi:triosephosphate isomerase
METDLKVIFCIGETLQERETGVTNKILASQLAGVKGAVKKWENLVLAYEPVWAIGTGKVATPEQAEDAHKFIREYIASVTDQTIADKLRIIYGGSVKSDNAVTLATKENIDGFLVGGASLKEDFLKISEALNTSA